MDSGIETEKKESGFRPRETSSVTLIRREGEILLHFNGDSGLYRRLREACEKRGIHFDFPLSRCG